MKKAHIEILNKLAHNNGFKVAYLWLNDWMFLTGGAGFCNNEETANRYATIELATQAINDVQSRHRLNVLDADNSIVLSVYLKQNRPKPAYVPDSIGQKAIDNITTGHGDSFLDYPHGVIPKGKYYTDWNLKFPDNGILSFLMKEYDCSYEDALQIAGVPLRQIHSKVAR